MNAPSGPLSSKDIDLTQQGVRGPAIGPALKRDVVLQRVRAARKRLSPTPGAIPRLR